MINARDDVTPAGAASSQSVVPRGAAARGGGGAQLPRHTSVGFHCG